MCSDREAPPYRVARVQQLVEFPVGADGETLVVEVVEPAATSGEGRATRRRGILQADRDLEDALDRVRPAAAALLGKLRGLAESPDEVTIEFGVKLTAKAGAVLASAAIEGNYKVTLTWKQA